MNRAGVSISGQGETLLMIHGIISDGSFFKNMAVFLEDEYRVIVYDRCGYGENEASEKEDYSVEAQAEYAAELIRDNAPDGAWIFGNSAGGLIAVELCLKYPELVKGMLLLEPSLPFDEENLLTMRQWNQELNGYLQQKKIKKALPAFARFIGEDKSSENMTLSSMKRTYKNLSNFMYGELNEVQHYRPEAERLRSVRQPVYIVITEDGKDSGFAKSSLSCAETVGWPVRYYPGNHNMAKNRPEEAAACVKRDIEEMKRNYEI